MRPIESMEAMRIFADENLADLCSELVEWQETSLLRDGKMRELASLCTFDASNTLTHAERCTERAAIRKLAEGSSIVRNTRKSP